MSSIGVDIGGTFTDFLIVDDERAAIQLFKVPSTPLDPSQAFLAGITDTLRRSIPAGRLTRVVHGTTVATNTVIQRNGARTGLITTRGFRDVLEIGRSNRPHDHIYGLQWIRPRPLVERYLRIGVSERVDSQGRIVEPLDEAEFLRALDFLIDHGVEAVAIAFLFSYVNPTHERRALELGREQYPHVAFSISSSILPQWREYERTNTTVVDAFIKPVMDRYLGNLERSLRESDYERDLLIMKSNGGIMQSVTAREYPIETFLSGPAAAVVAAQQIGERAGFGNLISIDMGGTSFDLAMIENGAYRYTTDAEVEPTLPVNVAMIDIRTIGAGGGSIAWVDEAGALKVGPKSAGADPGPACYGRGGIQPTVTDANVVLGRIDPAYFLGGEFQLRHDLAHQAISRLADHFSLEPERMAQGILDITVAAMAQEIRSAAAARGVDPGQFVMLAGGGAGALHAPQIAREAGIRTVLIPPSPGLLSAIGLLLADLRIDSVRTFPRLLERTGVDNIRDVLHEMIAEGIQRVRNEGFSNEPVVAASLDMRYERQAWEINIDVDPDDVSIDSLAAAFDRVHERLYGFALPGEYHEVINVRVTVSGTISDTSALLDQLIPDLPSSPGLTKVTRRVHDDVLRDYTEAPVYDRNTLARGQVIAGTAIIDEPDSTIYIPSDCRATVDDCGNIVIQLGVG